MDHGYEVDNTRRCRANTKKLRQCEMFALRGIELCALHAGLAKGKDKMGYGDPKALDAYKRSLPGKTATAPARR